MILIRKFKAPDFQWIINIEKEVFNEHDPYYYMQFYEIYPESFIVAEINGIITGYVVGFQSSEKTGRVFSLAVHPKYQNKGIGKALLKEIIYILSNYNIKEIILEVRKSNMKAIRFYEKLGFIKNGNLEKYYHDGESAVLMKFELHKNNKMSFEYK